MFEHVFQFLPATSKFNEQMWQGSSNRIVVVDLEDSLQNVIMPQQNSFLKKEGREKLLSYFNQSSLKKSLVSLRVNRSGSDEFEKDLQLLQHLENIKLDYIFVPKVESKEELENYSRVFSEFNIEYNFLLPIIETRQGLLQLETILLAECYGKLRYFVWGHHDYNLDAGYWPFIEQNSEEYWNIASEFIQQVEAAGYHYPCGPLMQIRNDELFLSIASHERSLCSKSTAHVALNHRQAKLLHECILLPRHKDFSSFISYDKLQKIQLAKKTVSCFQHCVQTGFTIDEGTGTFISPQQYIAALDFLDNIKS